MGFNAETAIRILTMTSLGGLLFTTGLRLTWREILDALRGSRLSLVLPVNFILVPALTFCVARLFHFPANLAIGMMLLAAAPFAPVVPVFTKMSRGNMALAGALTALFPLFSAFITPVVCQISLKPWMGTDSLKFHVLTILAVLASTITLPLLGGVAFGQFFPRVGRKLIWPCEIFSETTGAISLGFVSYVEFPLVHQTGWIPLLVMALIFELSLATGYWIGPSGPLQRRVTAMGASNRNIALAILVGIESFPGTPVLASVVANGLLLIFLGLLHVAWWRFCSKPPNEAKKLPQKDAENAE